MGLLNFFKKNKQPIIEKASPKYADSSSIPEDQKQYYRSDDYYTLTLPGIAGESKVITFDERKRISFPSNNGLYVPEILLLHYCEKGKYPNPEKGYPGFWWFKYGIRNVGERLDSLESRGFIQLDEETQKYRLTELGKQELDENGYVPYMHSNRKATTEESIGNQPIFNVWSINALVGKSSSKDWKSIVQTEEAKVTTELDIGVDAEKAGDTENAIKFYKTQVAQRFDGSHPYDRLAIYYRKNKEYEKEIEVLQKAIDVFTNDVNPKRGDREPKLEKYKNRLAKAEQLFEKSKTNK